jgi:hypothetical protein
VDDLSFEFQDIGGWPPSPESRRFHWEFHVDVPVRRRVLPGSILSGNDEPAGFNHVCNRLFRLREPVSTMPVREQPLSVEEASRIAEECLLAFLAAQNNPSATNDPSP